MYTATSDILSRLRDRGVDPLRSMPGHPLVARQDFSDLAQAIELLKSGNVVVIPTETVYGLAGDCTNEQTIQQIYLLKKRPAHNPLIIHASNLDMAKEWGVFDSRALEMAKILWHDHERSITFILPKKDNCRMALSATAGLSTVGIRVPHHPVTHDLIEIFSIPLAAPSANPSSEVSPTDSSLVDLDVAYLDGGACCIGLESTILDLTKDIPCILRPGECSDQDIFELTGAKVVFKKGHAPGSIGRHYSPKLPLRLNVENPFDGEAYLCLGKPKGLNHFSLSETNNLYEVARNLFSAIKLLDRAIFEGIAVAPIPFDGIGVAINDRLLRASQS